MISLRRFFAVLASAATLNAILFTTAFRNTDAVLNGSFWRAEYWMMPPLGVFMWVLWLSFAFTALGLPLLLAISRGAIPHIISDFAAKVAFALGGAVLGYVLFGLLIFESPLPAVFGAVAAITFTVMCPRWFEPWDKGPLAEPRS